MAEPIQLPLFPDHASLARIRPERNEGRFYRLEIWPDLFGRALLLRHWGRIGTEGPPPPRPASRSRRRLQRPRHPPPRQAPPR